jgi:inorganic pyrophosphatase
LESEDLRFSGEFWRKLDRLVAEHELVIDRPKGSRHPRYPEMVYPLDYGYLAGTQAADGAGIDVWVGSLLGRTVTAVVCTVDMLKQDMTSLKKPLRTQSTQRVLRCDLTQLFPMRFPVNNFKPYLNFLRIC